MAENEQAAPTGALPPEPALPPESAPPEPPLPPEAAPPAGPGATRWRETLWTFRSVIAVAVASLLVGGVGGALIVAAADDGHDQRRPVVFMDGPGHRMGPKLRHFQGPPGWSRNQGELPTPPTPTSPVPSSSATPTPSS